MIPANCTDRLQPLDISVNKGAKHFFYEDSFRNGIQTKCHQFQGIESKEPVDPRLTIMKPLGSEWMISLYEYFKSHPEIIQNGVNFIRKYLEH